MTETTPMTLRIDTELKAAAEKAAKEAGMSLTEYVQRSLKSATNSTCATCGRSSQAGSAPPGFSQVFADFYAERIIYQPLAFVVFTEENGELAVYWGTLMNRESLNPNTGTIALNLFLSWEEHQLITPTQMQLALIPRGLICGWRADKDGDWYKTMRSLGYADGNEPARRLRRMRRR
jgi:hypothetical protein